jgi:predicted nucleic acid-binding protein
MIAVVDATFLLLFIDPNAKGPIDPKTGKPLEKCLERVEHLIDTISNARTPLLIPTPVLAELLLIGRSSTVLADIESSSAFRIVPFDQKAAVELALLADGSQRTARAGRRQTPVETRAKLKFDRQIIAIAKTNQATLIYTDDVKLAETAKLNNIDTLATWELSLPPIKQQQDWVGDKTKG